jgi:UDP-glucose:(heptosyl)LPS alpha-1,3-glucosyltransferase
LPGFKLASVAIGRLASREHGSLQAAAMKLGLVRRGYSGTGGAESYARRFAEAAIAAGHECVLFGSSEWEEAEWLGPKVIVGGRTPRQFATALRKTEPKKHCDFLFSLERVWECDAYRAGDGVHAAYLQRRAAHEHWWKPFFRRLQRKHREILKLEKVLFTRGAGRIIANSTMVRREIEQIYRVPAARLDVVLNGVPQVPHDPELRLLQRKEFGLAQHAYALLFAGSGWERKGLKYAIEATRRVPGATLFIAGKGKQPRLRKSDRVHFLGPQGPAEMQALFNMADVFLLPTIYEPFSNACLEAMAAGLPVITTAANGFAELLSVIDGEIVSDPSDVRALAAAIVAWQDPAKRAGAWQHLRAKASKFTVEANLAQTLEIIARQAAAGK